MATDRNISKVVLVVDDDANVRDSLADALTDEGYRVATAPNGAKALAWLRSNPAPCVILLDYWMPVMNGAQFRAAQIADSKLATIPVILISAVVDAREAAQELCVEGWLGKPIGLDDLLDAVRVHCK